MRIVIVGGGYAGQMVAVRLANAGLDAEITLVDAAEGFVERVRLHEYAAGTAPPLRPFADLLEPIGVRFVRGWAAGLRDGALQVRVGSGSVLLPYDRLVLALGSVIDDCGVPGVREHAHLLGGHDTAAGLAAALQPGRQVTVVGGGLTGLELATELAERHPELAVRLVSSAAVDAELAEAGGAYVRQRLGDLGVELIEGVRVTEVRADAVVAGDAVLASDVTVWAAGFRAPGFARAAGLPVNARGQVQVDAALRVVGHPAIVAAGDAAEVVGQPALRMGCVTAMPMGAHVADTVVREARGLEPRPFEFAFWVRCISLGRTDALVQVVDEVDRPQERVVRGAMATATKEMICKMVATAPAVERRLGLGLYRWPKPRRGTADVHAPVG